eukprot:336236-Alexandrium_andersonii.AAC.1
MGRPTRGPARGLVGERSQGGLSSRHRGGPGECRPHGQTPTSQKCSSQASCPMGGQRQRTSSTESADHRRRPPSVPAPAP